MLYNAKIFKILKSNYMMYRNLEFLGIARKTKGWKFQYPSKEFYHRYVNVRNVAKFVN